MSYISNITYFARVVKHRTWRLYLFSNQQSIFQHGANTMVLHVCVQKTKFPVDQRFRIC